MSRSEAKSQGRNPNSQQTPSVPALVIGDPSFAAVHLRVNGQPLTVAAGTVVAAAVARAGVTRFLRSALGQSRGPLCGMGICMECRVTIDGQSHCRSCRILCREGMDVRTAL